MTQPSRTILLIEDNDDDVFAMRRALVRAKIDYPLEVVTDGKRAIEYFSGAGQYSDRRRYPLPFLTFLDLKLPYFDGFEILTWLGQQPALSSIPVVVLTGSALDADQQKSAALGAKSYMVKQPTIEGLTALFSSLEAVASPQLQSLADC